MPGEKNNRLISSEDSEEKGLEVLSLLLNLSTDLGGTIANVLSGMVIQRKFERVEDVLQKLHERLDKLQIEVDEEYVKSEEFEDILEQTLQNSAIERSEIKRQAYANFLASATSDSKGEYSDKEKHLKTLSQIQEAHVQVLGALNQAPGDAGGHGIGSIMQTLQKRIPGQSEGRLRELITDLNNLGLTKIERLGTMITAAGAENLRPLLTAYGNRFLSYIGG